MGLATTRRHFRVMRVAGGHLFPFEHPEEAARAVRDMAETLGAGRSNRVKTRLRELHAE
jgi:carboxypeptidase C (cathepsin A)